MENTEVIFFWQFLNRYLFLVFISPPKYITISGVSFKSFVCVTCNVYKYIVALNDISMTFLLDCIHTKGGGLLYSSSCLFTINSKLTDLGQSATAILITGIQNHNFSSIGNIRIGKTQR